MNIKIKLKPRRDLEEKAKKEIQNCLKSRSKVKKKLKFPKTLINRRNSQPLRDH